MVGVLGVKDFSGAAVLDFLYTRKILRLKPQYDDTFSVILSEAKNLFQENHFVGSRQNLRTHFCFCNFGTTLSLRPTEIRWGTRFSFPSCKNIHRMFLLRQSLIEKRYLSRVRNGQGGEPCREGTFIAKVSRRKERIMGTKMVKINYTLIRFDNKTLKRVQGDKAVQVDIIFCHSAI